MISEAEFTALAVPVLVGGLMAYMCFIMWKLGKDSKAGRFGMLVIFIALGLGMTGLLAKSIITFFLEK